MKIVSIDTIMIPPEKVGFGTACPVLCRVNTDEGIYGYGEAGVTFFLGSESVEAMIRDMGRMILGMDPMENEVIWEHIYRNGYWTKGNGAILVSALSAIDTALWDIKGKALGKPIYELLGGKFRSRLRSYASQLQFGFYEESVPQFTPEDYRKVTQVAVDKGYDAVKVDPILFADEPGKGRLLGNFDFGYFDHKTLDVIAERMRVTREVMGKNGDVILEMHCSTDLQTAIQVAKACEPYDIMYLEEPISPLYPDATKRLSQATSIPLTTGERSYLRAGFMPLLQDRSLSTIQPDIGNCGGITECKKIVDLAYAFDVGVQAHVCGTPISVAAGVQLEAAAPNFIIHEAHISSLTQENRALGVYDDFLPVDGYITVPDRPGLGQELSQEALKRAIVKTVQ